MIGCIINCLAVEHRAKANAIAQFCYNLLGYLPSPYVYGKVCELTGGKESRWGLVVTVFASVPAFLLVLAAYFVTAK